MTAAGVLDTSVFIAHESGRSLDAIADLAALPVDEDAARMSARMRVHLAEAGRRVRIKDLWIAAVAASRDLSRHAGRGL